jgi:hypothetical protein
MTSPKTIKIPKTITLDNIPVDDEWFENIKSKDIIKLIRLVRHIANMGLVEAKNFVADNCMNGSFPEWTIDIPKTKQVLEKWMFDEIQAPEIEESNPLTENSFSQQDRNILKAISSALIHWKELGFNDKFDACHLVLDNLKNKEE